MQCMRTLAAWRERGKERMSSIQVNERVMKEKKKNCEEKKLFVTCQLECIPRLKDEENG